MTLRIVKNAPPLTVEQALVAMIAPIVERLVAEAIEEHEAFRWDWVEVDKAAELIGISPQAVRHRIKRGQLPSRRIGRRIYIDFREFDRELRA